MKFSALPILALGIGAAQAQVLSFDCSQMPEVCTSMCYGAYCLGVGTALKYDKATAAVKRQRRKAAGCIASGGNRCSVNKGFTKGYQCDEYPFASTAVRSPGKDVRGNRCVLAVQNSRQGGALNKFYKAAPCSGKACDFSIGFANAGTTGVTYCNKVCTPKDSNQVTGPGFATAPGTGDTAGDGTDSPSDEEPTKREAAPLEDMVEARDDKTVAAVGGTYKTSTGRIVEVPSGAEIGQTVYYFEVANATLWNIHDAEWAANPFMGEAAIQDLEDNMILKTDEIVEVL